MKRRRDPLPIAGSDGVARAVHAVRSAIPPAPADLDDRILDAVGRARATPARRGPFPAILRPGPALLSGAIAILIVLTLGFTPSGPAPEPAEAVVSVSFTSRCGSDPGPSRREGQRIVVAGVWRGQEQTRFRTVLERFEQRTGIEVTYAYETRDIAKTLKSRLSRGCPPDVALLPQPGLLRDFAEHGQLKPIAGPTRALVRRNYAPQWRALASVRGELYGVWLKAANKSTFWYRRSAFEAAGVQAPATWEQLRDVAGRLRASGIAPFAVAGADGWTLTDWFENVYLRTAGAAKYDALARGELPWTDATVRTALARLSEIFGRSPWLAGGIPAALRTDFEESVGRVFSTPANAAMVFEGDFVASLIPGQASADAGTFAFPSIDGSGSAVVVGGDVAVQFTDNDAARALVHFLATPEAAQPWARAGGFISPNRRLDPAVYADPTTRRLAGELISAKTLRFDLSDLQPPAFGATAGQGLWEIFQRLLEAGPSLVDATTRRLQTAAGAARRCEQAVAGQC